MVFPQNLLEKPYFIAKMCVRPWSAGWPVQTFGSGLSQSLIIIIRISRKRSPLISDLDHLLG